MRICIEKLTDVIRPLVISSYNKKVEIGLLSAPFLCKGRGSLRPIFGPRIWLKDENWLFYICSIE